MNPRPPKKNFYNNSKTIYPFRSLLEKKIYQIIRKKIPSKYDIEINKRGLIKNRKRLEIDLYFPQRKIGVEIQGPTHTLNERNILHDYEKRKIFLQNNITIIYVYTDTYKNKIHSVNKCVEIITKENNL